MRSKIAAKIISETPQAVKDFVKNYANNMRNKDVYEVIEQAEREIQSLREQLKQVHNKAIDEYKDKLKGELNSVRGSWSYEQVIKLLDRV